MQPRGRFGWWVKGRRACNQDHHGTGEQRPPPHDSSFCHGNWVQNTQVQLFLWASFKQDSYSIIMQLKGFLAWKQESFRPAHTWAFYSHGKTDPRCTRFPIFPDFAAGCFRTQVPSLCASRFLSAIKLRCIKLCCPFCHKLGKYQRYDARWESREKKAEIRCKLGKHTLAKCPSTAPPALPLLTC